MEHIEEEDEYTDRSNKRNDVQTGNNNDQEVEIGQCQGRNDPNRKVP